MTGYASHTLLLLGDMGEAELHIKPSPDGRGRLMPPVNGKG